MPTSTKKFFRLMLRKHGVLGVMQVVIDSNTSNNNKSTNEQRDESTNTAVKLLSSIPSFLEPAEYYACTMPQLIRIFRFASAKQFEFLNVVIHPFLI